MTMTLVLLHAIIQSTAATLSWIAADMVNGVVLGARTSGGGGGLVCPIVLIPTHAVPRSFLFHSYSLVGRVRKTSRHFAPADYRTEGGNVWNSRSLESARS